MAKKNIELVKAAQDNNGVLIAAISKEIKENTNILNTLYEDLLTLNEELDFAEQQLLEEGNDAFIESKKTK